MRTMISFPFLITNLFMLDVFCNAPWQSRCSGVVSPKASAQAVVDVSEFFAINVSLLLMYDTLSAGLGFSALHCHGGVAAWGVRGQRGWNEAQWFGSG